MTDDVRQHVIKEFGLPFLAWITNGSEAEVAGAISGERTMSPKRAQILDKVVAQLAAVTQKARLSGVPISLLLSSWIHQQAGSLNVFNAWRREAGGSFPNLPTGDPLVQSLCELALDTYPLLLILAEPTSRDEQITFHTLSTARFSHPAHMRFRELVLGDSALGRLFPTRSSDLLEIGSFVMATTGRGGGLSLTMLSSHLIQHAFVLMRMQNQMGATDLLDKVAETIQTVREVAEGGEVPVPVFVGYSNIYLGPKQTIGLPWGHAGPYRQMPDDLVPASAQPSGEDGFLLETSLPYRIEIHESLPGEIETVLPRTGTEEVQRELNRHLDLTPLAFMLALERSPPIACTLSWILTTDPLAPGGNAGWDPGASSIFPPYILRESDRASVEEWARLLDDTDDARIRIAHRRMLSAMKQRPENVDGFIDAVIAWENLFGSAQGETTFRVTAAMACLLEDNLEQRMATQRDLSKIYGQRSRVLHGSVDLEGLEAARSRERALIVALSCLRKLYRQYPDLIRDASHDRARQIILRG